MPQLLRDSLLEIVLQLLSRSGRRGKVRVMKSVLGNLRRDPASMVAAMQMAGSEVPATDLQHVVVPTLLLRGERDRTMPPRLAVWYAERLANSTLRIMPGVFHDMVSTRRLHAVTPSPSPVD